MTRLMPTLSDLDAALLRCFPTDRSGRFEPSLSVCFSCAASVSRIRRHVLLQGGWDDEAFPKMQVHGSAERQGAE